MDWTVKDFAHANHNPVFVVNGRPGTGVRLEIDPKLDSLRSMPQAAEIPMGSRFRIVGGYIAEAGLRRYASR